MPGRRREWLALVAGCVLGTILVLLIRGTVLAECQPYEVTEYSPTGIMGCEVYGTGTASMWGGPGAARNDCIYPWTDCQTISVQSAQTGLTIVVTPTMFCDCYTGTDHQRIVDLDRSMVIALGLDPDDGLWPVEVKPTNRDTGLPDTAFDPLVAGAWLVALGAALMVVGAAMILAALFRR